MVDAANQYTNSTGLSILVKNPAGSRQAGQNQDSADASAVEVLGLDAEKLQVAAGGVPRRKTTPCRSTSGSARLLIHWSVATAMPAVQTITEEILELKRQRRAMILAHHYQDSEIQEIADSIGDSLELSRAAQKFDGDVIAFCGVVFMAETAKVLNPSRVVVLPDMDAGCSLVDALPRRPSAGLSGAASRARRSSAISTHRSR